MALYPGRSAMKTMSNTPGPLAIDFAPKARRPARSGWLLLLAGLTAVAMAGIHLSDQAAELSALRSQLAALSQQAVGKRGPPSGGDPAQMQALAARLGADWGGLLATLAQALEPGIRVLEVHGDAVRGSVRIVAEAPSLEAAFAYVERLQGQGGLRSFALDSHAWSQGANVGVLTFWAVGEWGGSP